MMLFVRYIPKSLPERSVDYVPNMYTRLRAVYHRNS